MSEASRTANPFDLRGLLGRRSGQTRTEGVWIALILLVLFATLRYDRFFTEYNILSFLSYNSMFVLVAIGMCFVIITGGIDLSVGSVAAFSSVVSAMLSSYGLVVALPDAAGW